MTSYSEMMDFEASVGRFLMRAMVIAAVLIFVSTLIFFWMSTPQMG